MSAEPQYEVCWSGAHWRTYPAPVLVTPREERIRPRASQAGAAFERHRSRDLVYACVDTAYGSVESVMARTGLSDRTVRTVLRNGVDDGTLERIAQARVQPGGCPKYLYRRRQAQDVSA